MKELIRFGVVVLVLVAMFCVGLYEKGYNSGYAEGYKMGVEAGRQGQNMKLPKSIKLHYMS